MNLIQFRDAIEDDIKDVTDNITNARLADDPAWYYHELGRLEALIDMLMSIQFRIDKEVHNDNTAEHGRGLDQDK